MDAQRGFSLPELLVSLAILSVLMLTAISNMGVLNRPLVDASNELLGFFKQVRARSISTTAAYRVMPSSSSKIITDFADTCTAEVFTSDSKISLDLPSGVLLSDTDWSVCFTTRGLSSANITITLQDNESQTRTIEVFLGGGVKIL